MLAGAETLDLEPETSCLTWLKTTASDAALIAVVAARRNYTNKHPEAKLEDLIIYVSSQTHSLGLKAALILGLQIRALPVKAEDNFSLRGTTLREALDEDMKAGKRPFLLSEY